MARLNEIKSRKIVQHKGLGRKLILEAEKIAFKEFDLKKMAVISGVGVRDYYRKLGYRLKDTYMIKQL
jgi:elongator complex protein 3